MNQAASVKFPVEVVETNENFKTNLLKIRRIPILMFHRVVEGISKGPFSHLQFSQANLDRLMIFLRKKGFEAVAFEDLLRQPLPPKPIMLTFDDGYEDNYHHLFPLLKKHNMKAVIFILGDRNIPSNRWDSAKGVPNAPLIQRHQLQEMAESGLVEFGGHSMTHADLTALALPELQREVRQCKSSLEQFLGKRVLAFAYPFGRLNETVKKVVAEAGFLFGIAVEWGPDHLSEDLMEIRRICLSPAAGPLEFAWKTSGLYPTSRRFRRKLFPNFAPPASSPRTSP